MVMVGSKNHDECVDILRVLYFRIMQLEFSYRWVNAIVFNTALKNRCPDMCYCLKWMFASDVYITLNGLLTDGRYSFCKLRKYCGDVGELVDSAISDINQKVPDFRNIRNKTFAHFMNKRDMSVVNVLFSMFDDVFLILTQLHTGCCNVFGISETALGGYGDVVFHGIQDEIDAFMNVVMLGDACLAHNEFLEKLEAVRRSGDE